MNLLAIETASETCSVALSIKGEVRERFKHAPRQHAELLLPWVEQLMAEAGIGFTALDAIAYSRGPGSFTSLRIGIGIVQGLAWASDRPVVPVSSLAATAQSAAGNGVDVVLVAVDARMNEVFTGTFEKDSHGLMRPIAPEKVCRPEDVNAPGGSVAYGIGNGFERYAPLLALSGQLREIRSGIWPQASSVLQLARAWLATNEPLSAEQAQPVYLRDNVAKKAKDR